MLVCFARKQKVIATEPAIDELFVALDEKGCDMKVRRAPSAPPSRSAASEGRM